MNTKPIYKSAQGEKQIMALYDAVLARWPVPYELLTIPTRCGDTFVIACGQASAPPLILLHGSCSNAVSWIGDAPVYSRYFRVYSVDIPGEPGRSAPSRPAWNTPAYSEWLEELLGAFKAQKASFVGLSLGGWMSMKFAASRPERVAKLVVMAPGGVTPARASFVLRAMLFSMSGRCGAQAIKRMTFGSQPIHKETVVFMDAIMAGFNPRYGTPPLLTDDELRRLTMPTLLIAGARDALLPSHKTAARMRRLVPDLSVNILPEAGHALNNVAAEVMPFLIGD
jgi:pimeloyl-ACP methyl ester carboxylesterase